MRRPKWLKTGLKTGISAVLFGAVLYVVPLDEVRDALQRADWYWVLLSLFGALVVNYLNSLQMKVVTWHLGITLNTWQIFKVNLITKFYSLFLPGYLAGGAIRWYHFQKQDRKPAEALAAIVLNRLLETSLTIGLGVCFWLMDKEIASGQVGMMPLLSFTLLFIALYLVSFNRWTHQLVDQLAGRLLPDRLRQRLKKLLDALGAYEDLPFVQHAVVLGLALLRHLLGVWAMYLLVLALGLNIAPETLGWIRSVVTLALMAPIAVGGFGVRELTFIGLLGPLGVDSATALTLSLLVFAKGLVFTAAGGLIEAQRLLSDTARKSL